MPTSEEPVAPLVVQMETRVFLCLVKSRCGGGEGGRGGGDGGGEGGGGRRDGPGAGCLL
ncbi:hypothetical protein Q9966_014754 [Columba livia]|nr:hypothetical protein Q9966_014754 [Columba livia]